MIYLITRPFVWLFKLIKGIVKLPGKIVFSIRDHRARKRAKFAAKAVKTQQKAEKQSAKAQKASAAQAAATPASQTGEPPAAEPAAENGAAADTAPAVSAADAPGTPH